MLHLLQRHHFPVCAHFERSLVLTYAFPESVLQPLLPPGLRLDARDGLGFVAVAMVQTRQLRPAWLPQWMGLDFFLAGYRIFTRYRDARGRNLRGLRILRSDTDRWLMVVLGNLATHYGYRKVGVRLREQGSQIDLEVRSAHTPVALRAYLDEQPSLPAGSPFPDWREARKYAGPLPFTFDYERATHSMVVIEGVREHWEPRPVRVEVERVGLLERPPFNGQGVLASAFTVKEIPYRWKRGVVEKL